MGSAVTFSLYFWLLSYLPAKRLALIAYVIPVIAVGLGVLRGESLTLRMLAGAAAVVGGVALAVGLKSGKPASAARVEAAESEAGTD